MSNEPDKVNSGALATMIVLVALATLAVALVVTALVRQETARLRAEGDLNQERPFRQLRSEQETKLTDAPAWVDQAAGIASIPIHSAMQMVLENVRENPLELSPGNKPAEEEEEEVAPEGATSETDAAETDATEASAAETDAAEATAPVEASKAGVAATQPAVAPNLKQVAPVAPAPSPKTPAPKTPAPKAATPAPQPSPAPAPGGPAQ